MKQQIARFSGLILLTATALAVAVMMVTGGWQRNGLPQNNGSQDAAGAPVSVMEARSELIEITDTYSGMIRPLERFSLGFEIAGRVEELGSIEDQRTNVRRPLDEGDRVVARQVLARLDDRLLRSQLEEAKAQHEETKAQREEAKARIQVATARWNKAQADLKRSVELWRRGGGAISQAEYQDHVSALAVAKAQLIEANAQLTRAEAQVTRAEAHVATAHESINDTTLLAPVDGVISKRLVNPGESVSPQQTIMEIIQIDKGSGQPEVLLVVGVPEAYVAAIQADQPVHVELLARDQFRKQRPRTEGHVRRVAEASDQTTGLFDVEIWLPNPDGRWKPGLIALAHIVLKEVRGFRIPVASAVFRDDETFMFVVDAQGTARRFDLVDWIEQGSDLIVPELPPDRRTVVRRGQHRLVDGRRVAIVSLPGQQPAERRSSPPIRSPASIAESPRPASVRD